jgi:hypothetical protein
MKRWSSSTIRCRPPFRRSCRVGPVDEQVGLVHFGVGRIGNHAAVAPVRRNAVVVGVVVGGGDVLQLAVDREALPRLRPVAEPRAQRRRVRGREAVDVGVLVARAQSSFTVPPTTGTAMPLTTSSAGSAVATAAARVSANGITNERNIESLLRE